MHYRRMYDDTEMLYSYDLESAKGRDVIVEIERVYGGELTGQKGRKAKKPFVKFKGREKKLALNKTNGKAIARMYGPDTDHWVGKLVALYVTTTEMDGEELECIRIRPRPPESGQRGNRRSNDRGEQLQTQVRDQMEAAAAGSSRDPAPAPANIDDPPEPGSQDDE